MDRVLDLYLFELRNFDSLCVGCHLGSWQHRNANGGRSSSRKRYSGNDYQDYYLFGCIAILYFYGAHSLGSSYYKYLRAVHGNKTWIGFKKLRDFPAFPSLTISWCPVFSNYLLV